MTDSAQSDGAPAVAEGGSTVAEGRRAAGTPVRIRLRGKDITVTPERVADAGEIDQLLMTMTAANPRAAAFIGVGRDPDGHFDPAGLQNAIQYGFRIVRWHPVAAD